MLHSLFTYYNANLCSVNERSTSHCPHVKNAGDLKFFVSSLKCDLLEDDRAVVTN
jgi:hypothetical protein